LADDRPAGLVDLYLLDGEEVPDDVLDQALQTLDPEGELACTE
jgi:hypothetical protein